MTAVYRIRPHHRHPGPTRQQRQLIPYTTTRDATLGNAWEIVGWQKRTAETPDSGLWNQVRRSRIAITDPSGRMETGPHPLAV